MTCSPVRKGDASVARFQAEFDQRGYGWWAVEVQAARESIGFAGLDQVDDGVPFTGVEIGWRLARSARGRGDATEAARAVMANGFDSLGSPRFSLPQQPPTIGRGR
ncbi:RimJ/RimL family protein N-acetyltransferase [Streptomyces sp. HB132]|nr:RimJ/RimL family protein N-acetyltransferase [Streptomyces sp. HB132]